MTRPAALSFLAGALCAALVAFSVAPFEAKRFHVLPMRVIEQDRVAARERMKKNPPKRLYERVRIDDEEAAREFIEAISEELKQGFVPVTVQAFGNGRSEAFVDEHREISCAVQGIVFERVSSGPISWEIDETLDDDVSASVRTARKDVKDDYYWAEREMAKAAARELNDRAIKGIYVWRLMSTSVVFKFKTAR